MVTTRPADGATTTDAAQQRVAALQHAADKWKASEAGQRFYRREEAEHREKEARVVAKAMFKLTAAVTPFGDSRALSRPRERRASSTRRTATASGDDSGPSDPEPPAPGLTLGAAFAAPIEGVAR